MLAYLVGCTLCSAAAALGGYIRGSYTRDEFDDKLRLLDDHIAAIAVVVRQKAVLVTGPPRSGKSRLCASLDLTVDPRAGKPVTIVQRVKAEYWTVDFVEIEAHQLLAKLRQNAGSVTDTVIVVVDATDTEPLRPYLEGVRAILNADDGAIKTVIAFVNKDDAPGASPEVAEQILTATIGRDASRTVSIVRGSAACGRGLRTLAIEVRRAIEAPTIG